MVRHLKDGEDFGAGHFPKDFGFSGSAEEAHSGIPRDVSYIGKDESLPGPQPNDKVVTGPTHAGAANKTGFATGGHVHPHGHEIAHVEHHHDGTVIHHHAHGGFTMHHPDGSVSHHDMHGRHLAHGGMHHGEHRHDPEGELAHRARGGDEAEDKAMVTKAVHQHEAHDHKGEAETDLHLARGGHSRIPRSMMPKAAHMKSPIGSSPEGTKTPRNNLMPKGQMGYGTEPSAEPDIAGSDQVGNSGPGNLPPSGGDMGMAKGGRRHARGGRHY